MQFAALRLADALYADIGESSAAAATHGEKRDRTFLQELAPMFSCFCLICSGLVTPIIPSPGWGQQCRLFNVPENMIHRDP